MAVPPRRACHSTRPRSFAASAAAPHRSPRELAAAIAGTLRLLPDSRLRSSS